MSDVKSLCIWLNVKMSIESVFELTFQVILCDPKIKWFLVQFRRTLRKLELQNYTYLFMVIWLLFFKYWSCRNRSIILLRPNKVVKITWDEIQLSISIKNHFNEKSLKDI